MASKVWFGTLYDNQYIGTLGGTNSNARMSWVPAPDPGFNAGYEGFSEAIAFENGGARVVSSAQKRRTYELEWGTREASGADGLDQIRNYQQGAHGPGLIYWADPMSYHTNVLEPQWAQPGLIELGYKRMARNRQMNFVNIADNSLRPPRRGIQVVASGSNTPPTPDLAPLKNGVYQGFAAGEATVVVIPPDQTLWLHWRGGASVHTSSVQRIRLVARPMFQNGSYDFDVPMTVSNMTQTNGTQYSFTGSVYKAVEIFIAYDTAQPNSNSMTLSSGIGQLWTTGVTPNLRTLQHIGGEGNSGLSFDGEAVVETYQFIDPNNDTRRYKGASARLIETGLWQN